MSVLICLTGGQQAPNLFAVEQCRPQKIILVHSEDTEPDASDFRSFLSSRGYEDIRLWKVDPYHPRLITTAAQELRERLSGEEVILNYTGGTKPMAIGFYQTFRDQTLLYVDTQGETFWWGEGKNLKEQAVELYLDLPVLFQLRRARISSVTDHNMLDRLKSLVNYLYTIRSRNLTQNETLKSLNYEVVQSLQAGSSQAWKPEYDDGQLTISESDPNKVMVIFDSQTFEIKNKDFWLSFFAGGWFEQWVYNRLEATGEYDDIRSNVTFRVTQAHSKNYGTKNEIDVAAIRNGVPVFLECKTGRVEQSHITNLRAVKDNYGTTYTMPVLVMLSHKIHHVLKEKLEDYGIRLILGPEQLENHLDQLHEEMIIGK